MGGQQHFNWGDIAIDTYAITLITDPSERGY
jgi:hypothetical protein